MEDSCPSISRTPSATLVLRVQGQEGLTDKHPGKEVGGLEVTVGKYRGGRKMFFLDCQKSSSLSL